MEIYILSESVCQKQPLRCVLRPSGAEGGQRGRLPPPSSQFSVDMLFFLMSPLIVPFSKEVTQNIHENQRASHEQIKIKHNTLKRNSFFV